MLHKVTVLGLGRMGSAIAKRFQHDDIQLTVYNRTASKMDSFREQGVLCADSIQAAVSGAEIVFSCLFDDASVLEVVSAETGILRHLSSDACYVSTETIQPATVKKLWDMFGEANKIYLPAAVLGGPNEVAEGKLAMFTAGSESTAQSYEHIFKLFTDQIYYMGEEPTWAMIMKLAMNYTYVTNLELFSELFVFAEKHGVPAAYIQKILYTVFQLPGFRECIDQIKDRQFDDVNFAISGGDKDVTVLQKAFTAVGVVPKLGNILSERYAEAKASGLQDKDWTAIYEVVRKESGLA